MVIPLNFAQRRIDSKVRTTLLVIGDVTQADLQRLFLTQHIISTLLRHCFEWLQHFSNIAALCCAKNRRRESSRVTSPFETPSFTLAVIRVKVASWSSNCLTTNS